MSRRNAMVFDECEQKEPITGLYFGIECCPGSTFEIITRTTATHWAQSSVVVQCHTCCRQWLIACEMTRVGNDSSSTRTRAMRARKAVSA